jgi:cytidine deaminase
VASALPATGPESLIGRARAALERAHCPYSGRRVGAALLGTDGRVYTGCNVESASYGLTLCAERTALVKAVSDGARRFTALAVANDGPHPMLPCGACRQLLSEFATELSVVCAGAGEGAWSGSLAELLPLAFGAADLGTGRPG